MFNQRIFQLHQRLFINRFGQIQPANSRTDCGTNGLYFKMRFSYIWQLTIFSNGSEINKFGEILHQGWEIKRKLTEEISSIEIDEYYQKAIKAGAIGGKLLGAGGGGYFMFYVPAENHLSFRKKMLENGFKEMHWQFDFNGVNTIFSD